MAPQVGQLSDVTFKPVTHCIFDMDGLLLDSEKYYSVAMNEVTSRYGKPFNWDTKVKMMGTKSMEGAKIAVQMLDLPITPQEFLNQVDQEYPKVFPQVQFLPGVERLLQHLNANDIPCAVASSSKRLTFEMKTKKYGDKFVPGKGYFHHIVLASNDPDVKRSKPFPDTFLVAKDRFGDKPDASSCLAFEDSVAGTIAGCRAGMQTIMIPDERLEVEPVYKSEPDFAPTQILRSMEDFRPELFGLPPFPAEA